MSSGTRRRREGAVDCLLCGSHMQCYREGKPASMVLALYVRNGLWKNGARSSTVASYGYRNVIERAPLFFSPLLFFSTASASALPLTCVTSRASASAPK